MKLLIAILLITSTMFKVEVQGDKEMQKALMEFSDDTFKKKVLTSVFRKAGKPFIKAARAAAPVASHDVKQGSHTVKPGTLKKAIGNWTFRKVKSPHLMLGAKFGKRSMKFDAWYYRFIEFGSVYQSPNPFLQTAWNSTKGQASSIMVKEFDGVLKKFKNKHGIK